MRTIAVTAGPLAAASANAIALSQTPTGGATVVLNGSLATSASTFSATASGNVLTVASVSAGVVAIGQVLTGAAVVAGTTITGVRSGSGGAGTYIISPAQTIGGATTMYGNALATMDKPRQVLVTTNSNETSNTITIYGTDWNGSPINESFAGVSSSTVASSLTYSTVTQIKFASTPGAAITVGTNGVASSPWVRLDEWGPPSVSKTVAATNTVNYTVQVSMDNPDSITSPPVLGSLTWVNDPDLAFVGGTASAFGWWQFVPTMVRVVLNSGTGSVTMKLTQTGTSPF